MFINKPVLIISLIFKYPEPKTTAFGGVATGSMKAQDAAIVALIIIINGLIPNEILTVAKIGNIIETVARFEVISVKKFTAKTIKSIINITDKSFKR